MRSPSIITHSSILIVLVFSIHYSSCKPQDVLSWSEFDLQFPSDAVKQTVLERKFQPSGMTPYDFDVWRDKLFFTLEGQPKNLPISVGFVNLTDVGKPDLPKIFGYPEGDAKQFDWKRYESKMTRVMHLHIDVCDRLWLLEEGVISYKQPQLIVYDLPTDKLLRKHDLPDTWSFKSLIVDATKGNCDKAYAYVLMRGVSGADKLTVYNFKEDSSYQINLELKKVENQTLPEGCTAEEEGGHKWSWDRDIQMEKAALLAPQTDGFRPLYFKRFFGPDEYVTSTKALQNKANSSSGYQYEVLGCRGYGFSPVSSSYFDQNTGTLFQVKPKAITCWNAAKHAKLSANTSGIYEIEGEDLRKIKVDDNGTLWIMTFTLYDGKITYKLSKVPVTEVVNGTVC